MSEELEGTQAGVEVESAAPTGADSEAATAAPEAQATASATGKVNLDELEEFRKFKSQADRRVAEATRRAQEAAKRAEELEAKVTAAQRAADEAALAKADPDERAAYWQNKARQMQTDMQRQMQEAAQKEALRQKGMAFLESVGLEPGTPGLDFGGPEPSQENLMTLMESATRLLSARATELEKSKQAELAKATRQAERAALDNAGVTRVGAGTGPAATDLMAQFLREKQALLGTGDMRAYNALKKKYRKDGLDV